MELLKRGKIGHNYGMLKRIKNIIGGILLLTCAVFAAWTLRNDTYFFIVEKTPFEIEVPQGHSLLASKLKPHFQKVLQSIQNKNIWQTDLAELKAQISRDPWVKSVELQRRFPNEVSFDVKMQEAVLHWVEKGKMYPLTRTGKKLSVSSLTLLPDRPILKDSDMVEDKERLVKFMALYLAVPNRGALRRGNIAEVSFQRTEGLTLQLIEENITVHLGHKNISTKGQQVLKVTEYLQSQKQKVRVIDASYNKKVLVRLRKRS